MPLVIFVLTFGLFDSSSGAVAAPVLLVAEAERPHATEQTRPETPGASEQKPPQHNEPEPKDDSEAKKPPTPPHTGVRALIRGIGEDFAHLPSMPNLYITTMGGVGALSLHQFDDNLNNKLRGHEDKAVPAFLLGKYIGQTPVQVGIALGTFAYGRTTHQDKVSHFGMDLLRAQIVTGVLTSGLKYATQRERPDHSNPHSFPSGHASVTFATATVIERHLGWKMSALGYTVAGYVASSRLHDNRHWLSDVVFGAAVGTVAGRTVTQHGRNYWTIAPVRVPGGVALMATRTRSISDF